MDLEELIKLLDQNNVSFNLFMKDKKVAEVKVKDKNIDLNIFDLDGLGKLVRGVKG